MKIAIIGGGPAGFFAAINTAMNNNQADITIFEATNRPLEKVRLSGGGRCNVTHSCFDPKELIKNYPRGYKELLGAFHKFQPQDMIHWLNNLGIELKTEDDGRIFPISDSSLTIVEGLRDSAKEQGVKIIINRSVAAVEHDQSIGKFNFEFVGGEKKSFDKVLIATGSSPQGYKLAKQLGHTIAPCAPSLFTFKIKDNRLTDLSGVSFKDIEVTLTSKKKIMTRGPMLITHWGLSGPAILKLSAFAARELANQNYKANISINFLPEQSSNDVAEILNCAKKEHSKKQIRSIVPVDLPKNYWLTILNHVGLNEAQTWANLSKNQMDAILTELTKAEFTLSGKGIFKEEFVTCGGVSLKEIDFKTMMSKVCPNLYFAGEVLDIDGITGGFNFQNAWTTGWIASQGLGMVE